MNACYDTFPTPLGDFSIALDAAGSVVAAAFGDIAALRTRFAADELVRDPARARTAREQLAQYFAGARRDFSLPLAPHGTPFQQRVWSALCAIPFGETRSYARLAAALGSSPRAVGRANATNPICVLVPCHRVIGADGSLTGYAFGETLKLALLEHEGVRLAAARALALA